MEYEPCLNADKKHTTATTPIGFPGTDNELNSKEHYMKKRYTHEEGGIVRITNPETGKLWYNHLWNDDGYLISVSQTGGGFSHLVSDKGHAVLHDTAHPYNRGNEHRYLYIRNDGTGRCWNPGFGPLAEDVDDFCCEHAPGYTKIGSSVDGIRSEWMFVVPVRGTCELWRLTLENAGKTPVELSVFPCQSFNLAGFGGPVQYDPETTSATEYDEELRGVICISRNPAQPHPRYTGYLCADVKPDFYDGWLEAFTGTTGSPARPLTVIKGRNCRNSTAVVRTRCAVLQHRIRLAPGEKKILRFVAGLSDGLDRARAETREIFSRFDREILQAESSSPDRYWNIRTGTPNDTVNRIMNRWAEKQVRFCMLGKKAVRDNAQVAMGLLNFDFPLAEQALAECIEHQYSHGGAVLGWQPSVDPREFSDPPCWLILTICELAREAGNRVFLDRRLRYLDGGDGTVYEHMQRAVERLHNQRGKHGLPLIHYADWNDALNIPDKDAESVFMAMAYAWALAEAADLAEFLGDAAYARQCRQRRENLASDINTHAWNGEYYVRALTSLGRVGDRDPKNPGVGGQIYINPQTWAILAGIVPAERIPTLCRAIDAMETDYGTPLCAPAYGVYDRTVGRMSGMLPGVYENGGIYNHACGFKAMAECRLKRKSEAFSSLLKMLPNATRYNQSEDTTADPQVFTNCYLMHKAFFNKVAYSWQTGSSAWGLRAFYEGILGIQRSYQGLLIDPCLPDEWKHVTARRKFRDAAYEIEYHNSGGSKVKLTVDGAGIEGNVVPPFADGKVHKVTVEL